MRETKDDIEKKLFETQKELENLEFRFRELIQRNKELEKENEMLKQFRTGDVIAMNDRLTDLLFAAILHNDPRIERERLRENFRIQDKQIRIMSGEEEENELRGWKK